MSKYKMPKNRKEFESALTSAFEIGMSCAYGVQHEYLRSDEEIYSKRFVAFIQGKINSMNECFNNEKTYLERNSVE